MSGRAKSAFDHPEGLPVFPRLSREEQYDFVLDFGCGCGRVARKLALSAAPMPKRYVGIDLHAGMINWANTNLAPQLPGFKFIHPDVFNAGFNPGPSLPHTASFPAEDNSVSLLVAISVFTHLTQSQAEVYLEEVRRVFRPDGVMLASFFLFEKANFPMMQDFQNALYINDSDPTNAVVFDREWLLALLDARELRIDVVDRPVSAVPLGARDRARSWLRRDSRGSRASRAEATPGTNQGAAPHPRRRDQSVRRTSLPEARAATQGRRHHPIATPATWRSRCGPGPVTVDTPSRGVSPALRRPLAVAEHRGRGMPSALPSDAGSYASSMNSAHPTAPSRLPFA